MNSVDFPKPSPQRKSIRLKGFDYSSVGAYFVTVCTHEMNCILGEIRCGRMIPNDHGKTVERCWSEIPNHFPDVACDEFTLMPNHVHGVLFIFPSGSDLQERREPLPTERAIRAESFGKPVSGSLCTVIRSFKSAATKEVRMLAQSPRLRLWHRDYHEHVVRNGADLADIRRYIRENPAKWESDRENPWAVLIREKRAARLP